MSDSQFQSTHPSWGATCLRCVASLSIKISIHAPIVGCDNSFMLTHSFVSDFNPRTHRGVRLFKNKQYRFIVRISIHAPIVGCDVRRLSICKFLCIISIHAPIVGCDIFVVVYLQRLN